MTQANSVDESRASSRQPCIALARGFIRCIAVGFLLAASPAILPAQEVALADPTRFLQDIKTLSAPNMKGRGDGSEGLTRPRYPCAPLREPGA
jgi:hypothetical protein